MRHINYRPAILRAYLKKLIEQLLETHKQDSENDRFLAMLSSRLDELIGTSGTKINRIESSEVRVNLRPNEFSITLNQLRIIIPVNENGYVVQFVSAEQPDFALLRNGTPVATGKAVGPHNRAKIEDLSLSAPRT